MKFFPMMIILAVALMAVAGVVVDGDGKTQAVQQSLTVAQGAARAGTNAATGYAVDGDAFTLSTGMAVTAANNYIRAAGAQGSAQVVNNQVVVTVETTYRTKFLSLIGIGQLTASANAAARLVDHN
ncbi:hypothetical protein [Leifsonia shinshuensis]